MTLYKLYIYCQFIMFRTLQQTPFIGIKILSTLFGDACVTFILLNIFQDSSNHNKYISLTTFYKLKYEQRLSWPIWSTSSVLLILCCLYISKLLPICFRKYKEID